MTVFELVRQEVTAKQAAEVYGLKFDRSGRGFCPWHDDGKHAALQFFADGGCYCHSCHQHGDATAITAQMLGLSEKDAAERIRHDFSLNQPTDKRPDPHTIAAAKKRRSEREELGKRWGYLCDVVREADKKLAGYTPETADSEFDMLLAARCRANEELDILWEKMRYERA